MKPPSPYINVVLSDHATISIILSEQLYKTNLPDILGDLSYSAKFAKHKFTDYVSKFSSLQSSDKIMF